MAGQNLCLGWLDGKALIHHSYLSCADSKPKNDDPKCTLDLDYIFDLYQVIRRRRRSKATCS